eukprot:2328868-Rhodomonas_salina.1
MIKTHLSATQPRPMRLTVRIEQERVGFRVRNAGVHGAAVGTLPPRLPHRRHPSRGHRAPSQVPLPGY